MTQVRFVSVNILLWHTELFGFLVLNVCTNPTLYNPLKTDFLLNHILKFRQETHVSATKIDRLFILRTIRNTQLHSVKRMRVLLC
jgi:hypothetical protein